MCFLVWACPAVTTTRARAISIRHLITTPVITTHLTTTAARVFTGVIVTIISVVPVITIATDIIEGTVNRLINTTARLAVDAPFSFGLDEEPFIGYLFQLVAGTHQIPISLSDLSTVVNN